MSGMPFEREGRRSYHNSVSINGGSSMSTEGWKIAAMATAATAALAVESPAAEEAVVGEVINKIKDKDDKVRYEALMGAGKVGPAAVKPLAGLMSDSDVEVARAAKRALWNLVRAVGKPGADAERKAAATALLALLAAGQPVGVQREVVWMLSEIAGDEAVEAVAALLTNKDLREDARLVLQRLPGDKSLGALKSALTAAAEDFKPNLAVSLKARGVEVPGVQIKRLVATRGTEVKPLSQLELEKAAEKGSKGGKTPRKRQKGA